MAAVLVVVEVVVESGGEGGNAKNQNSTASWLSKQNIYIDIGIWEGVCVVAFGKCAYVCTGYM